MDSTSNLITNLKNPSVYPPPVEQVEMIETHISWVLLAGDFVYKIKKPVDFKFLDFSTLEKRKYYCEEELRLNRRFAPQIYLDVVTIGGSENAPVLESTPALEYAVRMRRFDERGRFDHMLANGDLRERHIVRLVEQLARFHGEIEIADSDAEYGTPAAVHYPVEENFDQIMPLLTDAPDIVMLGVIKQWTTRQYKRLEEVFLRRKQEGKIRECHGDLHLQNIALWNDEPLLFDCIEFNPKFRWIDVISELAFLIMDLDDRNARAYSQIALNTYMQETGDFHGLRVLRFYLVYRALVRAKVALLRRQQTAALTFEENAQLLAQYREYVAQAHAYTKAPKPVLCIMHGLSGSGKSTLAKDLSRNMAAVHIRSDVERKRLVGLRKTAKSQSEVGRGLYSSDMTARTYSILVQDATDIIGGGYTALVDATFLHREQRALFRSLAAELNVPFVILHCHAVVSVLRDRVKNRQAAGKDPSEASLEVLEHQLTTGDELDESELRNTINVDMSGPYAIADIVERLREKEQETEAVT